MTGENVRLTEKQLTHGTARELLTLLRAVTADGRLPDEEIRLLGDWLRRETEKDLPALNYLRVLIENVLHDQVITETDRRDLVNAILDVMPEDICRETRLRSARGTLGPRRHCGAARRHPPAARFGGQLLLMEVLGITFPMTAPMRRRAN
jgi:hypothetical protein